MQKVVRTIDEPEVAFGPVPSRRLGNSLGINNIPAKVCSYACVYCQVGQTVRMRTKRQAHYDPARILRDVKSRLTKARQAGAQVDYLTFVPDGEPTLDVNIGSEIRRLKAFDLPVGVIANSSLLDREKVREDLAGADWVSLKVDAVEEILWRRINRPHPSLKLSAILDGAVAFADRFAGALVTETMLVKNLNENDDCLRKTADFIQALRPRVSYLSVPTRPPAEKWVRIPDEVRLNRAFQIFSEKLERVEYLIGYEGNAFAYTGDVEKDILSATAVHPMRKDAVNALLSRAGATWSLVDRLVARGNLTAVEYEGYWFYLRSPSRR